MAEIKPIRAWRYHDKFSTTIEKFISPLFDAISDKQKKALYQNPYNSIHISVPLLGAEQAAQKLAAWKNENVIVQDKLPGLYVYYQYFKIAGQKALFCRKGFLAHIRIYDWDEEVVLRHENTIPDAVHLQTKLLEKTEMHSSATHGLYTDKEFLLEKWMDKAISNPIYDIEDHQGVRCVLAVIHNKEIINRFIKICADKKILLADGHHRYQGSIDYQKDQCSLNPNHTGYEGYNFHFMYFSNTEANDLQIYPTHRMVTGLKSFNKKRILSKLESFFNIKPIEENDTINEVIIGKPRTFGILFQDSTYRIQLKQGLVDTIDWDFPDIIKHLNTTVLHYFILEKAVGISQREQNYSNKIKFNRSVSDCLVKLIRKEVQMAIITQEISIEEMKMVCANHYIMPQKSTYFYPKIIAGFLFASMKENEF